MTIEIYLEFKKFLFSKKLFTSKKNVPANLENFFDIIYLVSFLKNVFEFNCLSELSDFFSQFYLSFSKNYSHFDILRKIKDTTFFEITLQFSKMQIFFSL